MLPEGLTELHCKPRRSDMAGGVAAVFLLAALVLCAFLGLLGGAPHPASEINSDTVRLRIEYPKTIRSGEFFEARIEITPRRDIADLTLSASHALWREHTVNSMLPGAGEETSSSGDYRFSYGPVRSGEPFFIKIAFQLNPPLFGGTRGEIAVFDGDEKLAAIPLAMKVMP